MGRCLSWWGELTGATAVTRLISLMVPPVRLETKSSFWDFRDGAMFVSANTLIFRGILWRLYEW